MALHTVGPTTMPEDEQVIGRAYHLWLMPVLGAVPIVVAGFAETNRVIAAGFTVALPLLHELSGRPHDLCIRARRTNIILSARNDI